MPESRKQINEKVIAGAAQAAVLATEGVACMMPVPAVNLRGQRVADVQGIRLLHEGGRLVIDVWLAVAYGASIPETAWNVQENVKQVVKSLCDVDADKVNINVQGVKFDKTVNSYEKI